MSAAIRSILLGGAACTLALLCGCGSSSYGSMTGTSSVASSAGSGAGSNGGGASNTGGFNASGGAVTGVHNSIVATPESNLVSVQVGKKQTVAVTFTSSDGSSIKGFGLTNITLPAGWTGPSPFGCASVSSGSSCVLNLVYAPTAFETGKSVTLNYIYVDNTGTPVTNAQSGASISMSFNYQATTDDNILSVVAPAGQIVATTNSGSQPFTVSFSTDDGHPASSLVISAAGLPADMTPPSPASCDSVSAGTACTLTYLYQPMAPESGAVTFNYTYLDNSGTAKNGSFNVGYAASANNHVTSTVSPSSNPVVTATGTMQTVVVTFTTDDGFPASNLATVGDLTALLAANLGWSTTGSSFTCAAIDGGTGCQMTLTYGPTVSNDTGTVQIPFNYVNNAGVGCTGTLNINYHSS